MTFTTQWNTECYDPAALPLTKGREYVHHHHEVLNALYGGLRKVSEISWHLGLDETGVRRVLMELVDVGVVVRHNLGLHDSHKIYAFTPADMLTTYERPDRVCTNERWT